MLRKVIVPLFLLAVVVGAVPALAGEFRPVQGPKVEGEYIVVLNEGFRAAQLAQGLSRTHGGEVARTWSAALNGAHFVRMTEEQARGLARNPMVAWVEENGIAELDTTQSGATWGLDRIDQPFRPLNGQYTYNFDGSGVHVYVIDSGIRQTHNEFGSRATNDVDFFNDGQTGDCFGHGTHVAGTVGGTTWGVAKDVRLHAVRVFGCSGFTANSTIISGVDWVTANAVLPAVANMSLRVLGSAAVDTAVNNSVNSGVFYAVAAGNDNGDACSYSPARAANVYTVAATASNDSRAGFSNYGTCVDVFAPGVNITSAWYTSNSATNTIDGTSMASPHVAGVAALILEQHPTWAPDQVRAEITTLATTGQVTGRGSGSPNLLLYSLSGTGTGAPATPASLTISLEYCNGLNTLSWSSVPGATYYQLYGSTSPSFSWQFFEASTSGTSRTVNVVNTTYFRVRACNASGCSGYRVGNQPARYYYGCL